MSTVPHTRIYFEDEYCAVVYKAAAEDSQAFYTDFFSQKKFIAPVNRLDTPVSGILMLAFSPHIHAVLSRAFSAHTVIKEYWAVCERRETEPKEPAVFHRMEHFIGYNAKKQKAFIDTAAGASPRSSGVHGNKFTLKRAVLHWKMCGNGDKYDFIQIFPVTGRTHQIRAQMAYIGRPIKGDLKYGARRSEKTGGIRLHCFAVQFIHPVSGEPLCIQAEPQQTDPLWEACIKVCRPYCGAVPENMLLSAAGGLARNV